MERRNNVPITPPSCWVVLIRFFRTPHFLTLPIRLRSAFFAPEGVDGGGIGSEPRRLLNGVVFRPGMGEGAGEDGALDTGVCGVRGRERLPLWTLSRAGVWGRSASCNADEKLDDTGNISNASCDCGRFFFLKRRRSRSFCAGGYGMKYAMRDGDGQWIRSARNLPPARWAGKAGTGGGGELSKGWSVTEFRHTGPSTVFVFIQETQIFVFLV
jgi:hypothetical protein